MNRVRLLLLPVSVLFASVLAASGCGNKGRLVLPPPPDAPVEAPDATPLPPATDPTDSEPPEEIAPPPAGEPATDVPPPTGTPEPEDGDG